MTSSHLKVLGAVLIAGGCSQILGLNDYDIDPSLGEGGDTGQVGFAVGFIGIGAGVVLLLTGGGNSHATLEAPRVAKRSDDEGVKLQPWFGVEAAGLQGTF